MARNGSTPGAGFDETAEMDAFDGLPEDIREAVREAPFNVSAADMKRNTAVSAELVRRGPDAASWLREQFLLAYRQRFSASR